MRHVLILFILLWSALALSQDRGIPTAYMNDPAVDLTRDGVLQYPEDIDKLLVETKGRFDISTLNPVETSDLWKNTYLKDLPEDKNPIQDMDEVLYNSNVATPSGIYRFNIKNPKDNRLYTIMLGKNVHSFLMAKALLRKIGYQIPDMKHIPKVVVKFRSAMEKKSFFVYMKEVAMAGDPASWVIEELDDNKIILQDIVILDANHIIYNLAVGVTEDMIQGRRLLSSLSIPLTVTNLEESVNLFRWGACAENNKRIALTHRDQEIFQTTWDDARWATRRIEKLTREDWKAIVAASQIPKVVQQVLVEKIISRRNSMMKCFKIDAEDLKTEGHINNGVTVVDGKITQKVWPGYGSRFAHEDPESPLSDDDIKGWVKSRAISTLLDITVAQLNQLPFLGTDIEALSNEKYQGYVKEALAKSVDTQTPFEMPVKAWIFPTVRGQLILNRNLVTGTYLGTDNLVQLVDTVGVSAGAGLFAGGMGVGIKTMTKSGLKFTPIQLGASGEAMIMRTYSHIRPVTNLKKSLKYPFKNILVPLVKKDYGKKLHDAIMAKIDENLSDEDRESKVEEALAPFKEAMEIGESLIVTDSLATYVALQAGVDVYSKLLSISLGVVPGHQVISRFHVHRKTKDDFHVYRDIGNKGSLTVSVGVDTLIPVLNVSIKGSKGATKVKFYSLNLNKENPSALKNASALRRAIVNSSTSEMDEVGVKPFIVKHKFEESLPQLNILFWQWIKQNSSTDISVTNPEGDERFFRRQYHGISQGRNYQAYVNAVISHWVGMIFDRKAGLSDATGTNPGFSFKGRAKTKFLTLDQELGEDQKTVLEPFIKLTRIWNGWQIKRSKAEDILEEMKTKYRFEFFNAPILNDTRQIFLYNISVNMLFYERGIFHILELKEDEIKKIFRDHYAQESLVINPKTITDEETGVFKFLRFLKKFRKFSERKNKEQKANKFLLKAISHAESKLHLAGMAALVGGSDNMFATSRIDGFREGDEAGDKPIVSNSLGEFGSPRTLGPIVQLQKQTEMLEGEFFIYWMMTRLF